MAEHKLIQFLPCIQGICPTEQHRKPPRCQYISLWQETARKQHAAWNGSWPARVMCVSMTPMHGCTLSSFWFFYLCLIFMALFRKFYTAVNNQTSKLHTECFIYTTHSESSYLLDDFLLTMESENLCSHIYFVQQCLFCPPLDLPCLFSQTLRGADWAGLTEECHI